MNPNPLIDQAMQLTVERFQGCIDEDGQPYILHCLRVMMSFDDSEAQLVGLMHDLIEDTATTVGELERLGLGDQVLAAIVLLTHRPQDSYCDYVRRLKGNSLAKRVKLADLRDNSNIRRALYRPQQAQHDLRRAARYMLSYRFLEDRMSESDYVTSMAELE